MGGVQGVGRRSSHDKGLPLSPPVEPPWTLLDTDCMHMVLAEELVHTRVSFRVLLQHFGDRHLEILLSDILPSFSQSVHP